MVRKIISLTFLLSLAVLPQAQAAAEETSNTFQVRPGQYLWHVWESPVVKQEYPSWSAYFQETARLNNLPATERVWRNLPRGTVIKTPAIGMKNWAEEKAKLEAELVRLKDVEQGLKKDILQLQVRSRVNSVPLWAKITSVVFLVALVVLVVKVADLERKRRALSQELDSEKRRGRLEAPASRFVEENTYRFYPPSDLKPAKFGESHVVLLLGPKHGEDQTVIVKGVRNPVMIKNLKACFRKASSEVLEANGLVRTVSEEQRALVST